MGVSRWLLEGKGSCALEYEISWKQILGDSKYKVYINLNSTFKNTKKPNFNF